MDLAELCKGNLNHDDVLFLEKVEIDIRSYVNILNSSSKKRKVLLFPPVNNFRRFLVHHLVGKTFRNFNLGTLSIGKLYARRTVVYPAHLNVVAQEVQVKFSNQNTSRLVARKSSIPKMNTPDSKTKKSRKPDIKIYVPRGRRMLEKELDDSADANRRDRATELYTDKSDSKIKLNTSENWVIEDVLDRSENWDSEINDSSVVVLDSPENRDIDSKDNSVIVLDTPEQRDIESKDGSVIVLDTPEQQDIESEDNSVVVSDTPEHRDIESGEVNEEKIEDKFSLSSCDTKFNSTCDSENTRIVDASSEDDRDTNNRENKQLERSQDVETDNAALKNKESKVNSSASSSTKATSSTPKTKNGSVKASECDWEELFDDSGDFVDDSLVDELMKTVGKVSIQRATQDYSPYQTVDERTSDGECIIEVYDFPADFKTDDLFTVFASYRTDQGFQIVWVDETHALAIFSSPYLADEVLNQQLPCVKTRPLKNAVPKSRIKARNYVAAPVTRPKTCVSLARRLVSGHLGMKINITDKQREAEKKLLSDAREKRRQVAKQKDDVWESAPSSGR